MLSSQSSQLAITLVQKHDSEYAGLMQISDPL